MALVKNIINISMVVLSETQVVVIVINTTTFHHVRSSESISISCRTTQTIDNQVIRSEIHQNHPLDGDKYTFSISQPKSIYSGWQTVLAACEYLFIYLFIYLFVYLFIYLFRCCLDQTNFQHFIMGALLSKCIHKHIYYHGDR